MSKFAFSLGVAALMLPTLAAAHSALTASSPADGDVVAAPVSEIAMTFREEIRLTRVDLDGPDGGTRLELEDPSGVDFLLPADLGQGEYLLKWLGLGADGHPMKGEFRFEVE